MRPVARAATTVLGAVLVALLVTLALGATLAVRSAAAATPVRVMPLGDSITGSPGCWRALLFNQLRAAGITDVDFVGTLPPQGCGVSYDGDNEGHGGILATAMADQNQLPPWLAATRPDIVMMHLGTNDVWSNRSPATVLAAFGKLVDQMRAGNPAMRVLVAQIIPMNPGTCPECGARVVALNNAIPAWAAGKSTTLSPITVVDQWSAFSTAADTSDGVHPVDSGNVKIANRWLAPLSAAIRGSTPPVTTPPVTTPPVTTPPVTSPPVGGCTASYQVVGQWQGNFQGEITVRNVGASAGGAWTVGFRFPDGQAITQIWGGVAAQTGAQVSIANASYNAGIPAGSAVTFGFLATWVGTNSPAVPTCTVS